MIAEKRKLFFFSFFLQSALSIDFLATVVHIVLHTPCN